MAPKRHRGESSRSASTYDKKRFINEEAATYYDEAIDAKKLIPERGLDPGPLDGHLWRMIHSKKWGHLARQPEPAVVSIVKEFYANAKKIKHNEVFVRGKTVSFSATAINEYYGIPELTEADGYLAYMDGPIDYEALIRGLCQPDATWKVKDGEPKHFSYTYLSRYGKAWYYFMCAKLMPTTHITEVIKDRAILLYCIATDKSINMGQVINSSIKYAIKGNPIRGLPHPSLICELCKVAGVTWVENELTQDPQVIIDSKIIRNFKQWNGAPPEPKGAGFILGPPQSPDTEELFSDPPEPDTSTSAQNSINVLAEEMRQLRQETRRQTRRNDRQNNRIARRQAEMHNYSISCTMALSAMFAAMNPNAAPVDFPLPPVLSAYPPSDEDAQETPLTADDAMDGNQ